MSSQTIQRRVTPRLIVFARDGVVNERRHGGIASPDQWRAIPESLEALARLHRAGYQLILLSQQNALAEGRLDSECLHLLHERMRMELAQAGGRLAAIFYCPHAATDSCCCAQVDKGLLASLVERLRLPSLAGIPFITATPADLMAARKQGGRLVLLRSDLDAGEEREDLLADVEVYVDLAAFCQQLLSEGEA